MAIASEVRPQAYRREGAARALSISLPTLDRLIRRGELRAIRGPGMTLIPATEIDAYLQRRLEESGGS